VPLLTSRAITGTPEALNKVGLFGGKEKRGKFGFFGVSLKIHPDEFKKHRDELQKSP